MMRCASFTPSSTSKSAGSNWPIGPTPPRTVCTAPVDLWTVKPSATRRSMTASICFSVAPSCITTNIRESSTLAVLLQHAQALDVAHLVDDTFENPLDAVGAQRSGVVRGHVLEDLVLAAWLVDGEAEVPLHAADFFDDAGALAEQFEDAAVQVVDAVAAPGQDFETVFGGHSKPPLRARA